jgi:phosphopantothenoylcysteine decarboxylase/phosphopantothenate--cysteine ligase
VIKIKSQKLAGKKIALCVTGSVAAIQSPRLARELLRHGAEVTAYMSRAAADIIHPHTMEFATGREVITTLTGKTEHLMGWDLVVVAPATANSLAKMAHGMGDTPVTALLLSSNNVLIAPAMNQSMYENPLVKANIEKLKELGHAFVKPVLEEREAKMAPIEEITEEAIALLHPKDLSGLQFLVTAGATQEHIDPIRVITNNSSGKMGLSVAKEAYFRGATVTLVLGRGSISPPRYLKVLRVETVKDMLDAVVKEISSADVFISVGAVSDFRVAGSPHKLDSRKSHRITLVPAPKILGQVKKAKCVKVGFKALYNASEDELIASASRLMKEHALDLVVANDLSTGILGSDEAEVYILSRMGLRRVSKMSKIDVASIILDAIKECVLKDAG